MTPVLQDGVYVYASLPFDKEVPEDVDFIFAFYEAEGMTLVMPEEDAKRNNIPYIYPCRMITLEIHSSLEAVGFGAAITGTLATAGISTNIVSAYHHDHLFVPADRADEALEILKSFSRP